jgi:hypothetical protein
MTYSSASTEAIEEHVNCPQCDEPLTQDDTGLLICTQCGELTVRYVGNLPDCPRCGQDIVSYKPLTGPREKSIFQGTFFVQPCGHIVPGREFDTPQTSGTK